MVQERALACRVVRESGVQRSVGPRGAPLRSGERGRAHLLIPPRTTAPPPSWPHGVPPTPSRLAEALGVPFVGLRSPRAPSGLDPIEWTPLSASEPTVVVAPASEPPASRASRAATIALVFIALGSAIAAILVR